jgi:hypothetical protein
LRVTFDAFFACLFVYAMEIRTNSLPPRANKHLPFQVDDRCRDAYRITKTVEKLLVFLNINEIREL